jgi:hypothetical protein
MGFQEDVENILTTVPAERQTMFFSCHHGWCASQKNNYRRDHIDVELTSSVTTSQVFAPVLLSPDITRCVALRLNPSGIALLFLGVYSCVTPFRFPLNLSESVMLAADTVVCCVRCIGKVSNHPFRKLCR